MTDVAPDLTGRPYVLSVSGTRTVQPWEEIARSYADRLQHLATELGLTVHREPVSDDTVHRRWTYRRVSREDVVRAMVTGPHTGIGVLVSVLYYESPWSLLHQANAERKLRVHLHRLRRDGRVVKRHDDQGVERWFVKDSAGSARSVGAALEGSDG